MTYKTRGGWLQGAAQLLRRYVFVTESETFIVPAFSVSAYWPIWVRDHGDAMAGTVATSESRTGLPHVAIRSEVDHGLDALRYLTHEMIHVIDDGASGHRGQFAAVFSAIGMTGRRTRSDVGPELGAKLQDLLQALGPYPSERDEYLEA